MAENNLYQPRLVIGLAQKQEEITTILAECYSRDLIKLDEYERRIELVHGAATLDELGHLISDVPADVLNALKKKAQPSTRAGEGMVLTVDHGVRKLDDQRLAVKSMDMKATGGVIKLKYNSVIDLPEEIVINAELTASVLKIVVPPEIEVSEEMANTASVIKYRRGRRFRRVPVTARIRITGNADRSVVKIKTRRR